MRSMNLKFANTLESYTVESATAHSTLPPKCCMLESSHAICPPLQIIHAEPDIDFFAPTLSKVIWLRVLLLAPHHLPRIVQSRVLMPLHPPLTPSHLSPLSPSCHSSAMARTKQNAKKSTGGRATPASWAGSLPVKSKASSSGPKRDHKRPYNSGNNDVGSLPRYQCGFH